MSYLPVPVTDADKKPELAVFSIDEPALSTNNSPTHRVPGTSKLSARSLNRVAALVGTLFVLIVLFLSFGGFKGPQSEHVQRIKTYVGGMLAFPKMLNVTQRLPNQPSFRGILPNDELVEPTYNIDPDNGLKYPPDVYPALLNPYKRANAALISLVRNEELEQIRYSMRNMEERFNRKFGYPWIFFNDVDFTPEFKKGVEEMTRSKVFYHKIPEEHWSYPADINQTYAAETRQAMADEGVIYGGSESYRHMCRFNSGFFYRETILESYDYYWRVEPSVDYFCDVDYDPFLFMQENNLTYGFTQSLYEFERTIVTLWDSVREFVKENPQYVAKDNGLKFLVDDFEKGMDAPYNLCHFWSNFEIADLRFYRSEAYTKFFEHLDSKKGFFYERWGDAPVHSIAAALLLPAAQVHQFDDIAYRHNPFTHCPTNKDKYFKNGKCNCDPAESFDLSGYSCMRQWWRVKPEPSR